MFNHLYELQAKAAERKAELEKELLYVGARLDVISELIKLESDSVVETTNQYLEKVQSEINAESGEAAEQYESVENNTL